MKSVKLLSKRNEGLPMFRAMSMQLLGNGVFLPHAVDDGRLDWAAIEL